MVTVSGILVTVRVAVIVWNSTTFTDDVIMEVNVIDCVKDLVMKLVTVSILGKAPIPSPMPIRRLIMAVTAIITLELEFIVTNHIRLG